MGKIPDAIEMQTLARFLDEYMGGCGFALIVFEFGGPCMTNYISNGKREDMIKALKETVERLEKKQDFMTPNKN